MVLHRFYFIDLRKKLSIFDISGNKYACNNSFVENSLCPTMQAKFVPPDYDTSWNLFQKCMDSNQITWKNFRGSPLGKRFNAFKNNFSHQKSFISEFHRSGMETTPYLVYCFNRNSCWDNEKNAPVKDSLRY